MLAAEGPRPALTGSSGTPGSGIGDCFGVAKSTSWTPLLACSSVPVVPGSSCSSKMRSPRRPTASVTLAPTCRSASTSALARQRMSSAKDSACAWRFAYCAAAEPVSRLVTVQSSPTSNPASRALPTASRKRIRHLHHLVVQRGCRAGILLVVRNAGFRDLGAGGLQPDGHPRRGCLDGGVPRSYRCGAGLRRRTCYWRGTGVDLGGKCAAWARGGLHSVAASSLVRASRTSNRHSSPSVPLRSGRYSRPFFDSDLRRREPAGVSRFAKSALRESDLRYLSCSRGGDHGSAS